MDETFSRLISKSSFSCTRMNVSYKNGNSSKFGRTKVARVQLKLLRWYNWNYYDSTIEIFGGKSVPGLEPPGKVNMGGMNHNVMPKKRCRQSQVATLVPDKNIDRLYPKQKITLKQNNPTYHLWPVSPPSPDGSPLISLQWLGAFNCF